MTKVVINKSAGGFALSHEAVMMYANRKGKTLYCYRYSCSSKGDKLTFLEKVDTEPMVVYSTLPPTEPEQKILGQQFRWYEMDRQDPLLIEVIETLGEKANESYSELKVVEVPDDVLWTLEADEYGMEWIAESHRIWE